MHCLRKLCARLFVSRRSHECFLPGMWGVRQCPWALAYLLVLAHV